MTCIVAGIVLLTQHVNLLAARPEYYYINCCPQPDCGMSGLWRHGYRHRKADRENSDQATLNPVAILRLYCPSCRHTCSVLPECIPPRRWYLWAIQQVALQLFFSGMSFNKISQQLKPSRWTISRWLNRLKDKFQEHALHLKTKWSCLGYHTSLSTFWSALLNKIDLSHAMVFLHGQKMIVP